MLFRVVRMQFHPEHRATFLALFAEIKSTIRAYPGCRYLELAQDSKEPTIFITYSQWDSEESLDFYRQSAFFQKTWNQTKILFSEKPLAFSSSSIIQLP